LQVCTVERRARCQIPPGQERERPLVPHSGVAGIAADGTVIFRWGGSEAGGAGRAVGTFPRSGNLALMGERCARGE
jgi:hypothetical protein